MPTEYGRYIEPFCGSMSLFLRVSPEKSIVGDINEELINFYNQVKLCPLELSEQVSKIGRTKEEYYQQRSFDFRMMTDFERAVRFFYLNRHCFNGVYRTNLRGDFNVPFGSKLAEVPTAEELVSFSKIIKKTTFLNCDFEKTVLRARKGDFVYLDPPYAGTESKDRGEYGPNSFKALDIQRLGKVLRSASDKGVKILLSYASIDAIKDEFFEWNVSEIFVGRSVSGFASGRKKVPEVIITNY